MWESIVMAVAKAYQSYSQGGGSGGGGGGGKSAFADAHIGGNAEATSGGGGVFAPSDNSGWTVATNGSTARASAGSHGVQMAPAGGVAPDGATPGMASHFSIGSEPTDGVGGIDGTTLAIAGGIVVLAFVMRRHK